MLGSIGSVPFQALAIESSNLLLNSSGVLIIWHRYNECFFFLPQVLQCSSLLQAYRKYCSEVIVVPTNIIFHTKFLQAYTISYMEGKTLWLSSFLEEAYESSSDKVLCRQKNIHVTCLQCMLWYYNLGKICGMDGDFFLDGMDHYD